MKYVKWCLNESLRTHPVVPSNTRLAIRDTFLPSVADPIKNPPSSSPLEHTWLFPYAMHRRTDIYGPDAETFRPERWENLRPGWEYLPFNGGPRICLGEYSTHRGELCDGKIGTGSLKRWKVEISTAEFGLRGWDDDLQRQWTLVRLVPDQTRA